jgi:hypothetical protein
VTLYSYGRYHHEPLYENKALDWIREIKAEQNNIVSKFRELGVKIKNGGDTQSLIELKSRYCDSRRCLDCGIANALLKNKNVTR